VSRLTKGAGPAVIRERDLQRGEAALLVVDHDERAVGLGLDQEGALDAPRERREAGEDEEKRGRSSESWRRGRDSNPWSRKYPTQQISNLPHSTTLPPLRAGVRPVDWGPILDKKRAPIKNGRRSGDRSGPSERGGTEGEGGEPPGSLSAPSGFKSRRIRPLCHPSGETRGVTHRSASRTSVTPLLPWERPARARPPRRRSPPRSGPRARSRRSGASRPRSPSRRGRARAARRTCCSRGASRRPASASRRAARSR